MTIINRTTKLRWRRRFKIGKRQVEVMGVQAEEHFEKHLFKRLSRLGEVRRFLIGWVLLIVLLIGSVGAQLRALSAYYQTLQPAPGGVYTEGILGSFTNANPLYSTSAVDTSVARLVFAGLLKYNSNNQLVGDLADTWSANGNGNVYTVHLRNNLVWQDGKPLTADDVLFTYTVIQNPDAHSPLFSSWQGITVAAPDHQTIIFTLKNPLSSFPYSLTNGIVPKHLLGSFPMDELRSINFNAALPVGAGPFSWNAIQVTGDKPDTREQTIALLPNSYYHAGIPKLGKYVIRTFRDQKSMVASFQRQELTAMAGLSQLPPELNNDISIQQYSIPLTSETLVFFKNTQAILKDPKVRQALVAATNMKEILGGLGYPVIAAKEPLLPGQIGYDKSLVEPGFNLNTANKLLDEAGWKKDARGLRSKDGQQLMFNLSSQNTSEYSYISQALQRQWRVVGVNAVPQLLDDVTLQTVITRHNYDALLYGIELGNDPDVYAYWDSSQNDERSPTRLNFSEYQSKVADRALEAGRTRVDPTLRAVKYRPFLQAWRDDAPALALYQPRFLYVTRGIVFGLSSRTMNTDTDRFANVENWMIREVKVSK